MKNLDLNAYGVSEMNQKEMETVEGGNIFAQIAGAAMFIAGVVTGCVPLAICGFAVAGVGSFF